MVFLGAFARKGKRSEISGIMGSCGTCWVPKLRAFYQRVSMVFGVLSNHIMVDYCKR